MHKYAKILFKNKVFESFIHYNEFRAFCKYQIIIAIWKQIQYNRQSYIQTDIFNLSRNTEKGIKMETKAVKNGILEGVIWKQLLIFFFPILIGTFFQQLYNTVDAVIVGQFAGKEALSSVGGSSGQIINMIVGFFTGLTAGGTVLISQAYGAGDREKLEDALHTSYAFGIVGGILLGILGILIAPSVLRMMNTPEELMAMSTLYIQIYFSGLPFVFLYNMGAAILRAIGDSKRPLYYLVVCCFINIVLDLLLVLVFDLGVLGAAVATLVSQAVSTLLITWTLMRKVDCMKLSLRKIRIQPTVLGCILRIGLPSGLQASMYSISNIIVQAALNLLGVDTMAAWASFGKIDSVFWMINASFGIAATTFVGQNYGAGRWDRVKKGTYVCLGMALGSAVVMSVVLMAAGRFLFGIFTGDASVVAIGLEMMRVISPTYAFFVFIEIFSGSLRAQGHTLVTTLVTVLGICVYRMVWVGFVTAGQSLDKIIACYPISWIACAAIVSVYYFYKQRKILKEQKAV